MKRRRQTEVERGKSRWAETVGDGEAEEPQEEGCRRGGRRAEQAAGDRERVCRGWVLASAESYPHRCSTFLQPWDRGQSLKPQLWALELRPLHSCGGALPHPIAGHG